MDKCKKCKYGVYAPLPDEQIGHEGRSIPNWDCDHPDDLIKKQAGQIGFTQNCPYFEAN